MSVRHLGAGFDIHGGGLDLVFPHHENEIAQHEAAHGTTFARHWVHNGMVRMGEEKMSKSVGNVVPLADALDAWGRGPLRLWYLSAQHRTPLTFETDRLRDAATVHERFLTFLRTAALVAGDAAPAEGGAERHAAAFTAAMDDDLNAPVAIAALHELVTAGNELATLADRGDDAARAGLAGHAAVLARLADGTLGLGLADDLAASRAFEERIAPLVAGLLAQRAAARAAKDFATADRLRDELAEAGVVVEDRPEGPRWYATGA